MTYSLTKEQISFLHKVRKELPNVIGFNDKTVKLVTEFIFTIIKSNGYSDDNRSTLNSLRNMYIEHLKFKTLK